MGYWGGGDRKYKDLRVEADQASSRRLKQRVRRRE